MGRSRSRRTISLPVELTSFVGRQQEVAKAKRLLSASKLLTLTGAAGVGKTRLAMRVANTVSHAFPDGVWLVPLAPLHDEALVVHAVADVLGIRDETGRDPFAVLVEHLRERKLLLVLDNCEHLLEPCARLLDTILAEATEVRVLATSRHRLDFPGEHLLRVSPLQVPESAEQVRGANAVNAFPALELFADRAAAVVRDFRITAQNQQAVARLCRGLDGLPLAIELAAARMRALSVEQLAERLDDRYPLLTGGSRTAIPRHQTLRAAVDWSHELCTPSEQLVWALLSVFAGSFDLNAAEAVGAGDDIGAADLLDAITGLVDKSVLISEHDATPVRYRLLSSLREYGLEKLDQLGKVAATRRQHRNHYLHLAQVYEKHWFGPRQSEIIVHLRAEHDNLRAAFDFCRATPGEAWHGLHLAGTLWFYVSCCGIYAEARQWLRTLARCDGTKLTGARTKTHWAGALTQLIHSRLDTALLAGDRSARPVPEQEDLPIPPLANGVRDRSDLASLAVLARVELVCALVFRGQPERAVPLCVEALAVSEAHSEQWARSYLLRTLATARWMMGEHDSATTHARECLRLEHAVLGPHGISGTLDLLAAIAAGQDAPSRAAVLLGAAEEIWHDARRGLTGSQQGVDQIRVSELRARTALGDRDFERAFRRGSELSPDEAVAYAMRDRTDIPILGTRTTPGASFGAELTPRERQVAELVARGLTDKQIAGALVIAQRTAESHVQHILVKLGFTSRTQVAAWFKSQQL